MLQTQFLVVGLGIAGTLISYELWKAGKDCIVIDGGNGLPAASLVAGAVMNPVNINRWEPLSNVEQFLPEAIRTYRALESLFNIPLIEELAMLSFQSNETFQSFLQKKNKGNPWLAAPTSHDLQLAKDAFRQFDALGIVRPVWKIHAATLIAQWRSFLKNKQLFIEDSFNIKDCAVSPHAVLYKNIAAEKVIFCEGAAASQNPFFHSLPFTKNRGEALLVAIPGLSSQYIYHHTIRLVPADDHLFWCGSNYQWQFDDLLPNRQWRLHTEQLLHNWLRLPFTVEDHIVAERPTTAGQEFLVGVHPVMPSVAILNGLGTKGFSAGPLLAKQLCNELLSVRKAVPSLPVQPLRKWLK
ncbi:MAG: FAD-binding oxidoreductase [Chitinophagaceae bacterium]|nr:FAD-binding oxidoreductase [Chitinophagaceae bacterium]